MLRHILPILFLFCTIFVVAFWKGSTVEKGEKTSLKEVVLPAAKHDGTISIEHVLQTRRSIRHYKNKPITLAQLSQILWAAQGITSRQGLKTAPSAGALYPMEMYVVAGNVTDLAAGVYKYNCKKHKLIPIKDGDKRSELASASLGQSCVGKGAADIVIAGVYERTSRKYGARAKRYVYMEAGHIAQNIYLQAVALDLGTVTVGAFTDAQVKKVIGLQPNEEPLYVMPIGVI